MQVLMIDFGVFVVVFAKTSRITMASDRAQ
jgi:hypothetical protein